MDLSTRVKNFLKTGKINLYEQTKNLLLENGEDNGDVTPALRSLSQEEKERLLQECWPKLNDDRKRIIVNSLYLESWKSLTLDYAELPEIEKIKRLEHLGYISSSEVVFFLLEEMKSKREGIRLSACGALKKQAPELVLEPALKALTQPEEWLPSRIFEVLRGLGPDLNQQLIQLIDDVDEKVREVIVQILGEVGNKTCLPVFERLLPKAGPILRQRMAEALEKLKFKDSWPLLIKLLEDERWQTRMLAAKALGQLGQGQLSSILEASRDIEEDPLVKECICDALIVLEGESIQIVGNWVREGR